MRYVNILKSEVATPYTLQTSDDYFIHGSKAAFEGRKLSRHVNLYWPLFLGELVKEKDISEFKV